MGQPCHQTPGETILAMGTHVFHAEIWEHAPGDPGSWHFLTLPEDTSEDVALEGGPRTGFGSVRVEVSIGATTWRTSVFPDSKTGRFVLPVKKPVRVAEGLVAGDVCEVVLDVEPTGAT
jgi:hypothetical protein